MERIRFILSKQDDMNSYLDFKTKLENIIEYGEKKGDNQNCLKWETRILDWCYTQYHDSEDEKIRAICVVLLFEWFCRNATHLWNEKALLGALLDMANLEKEAICTLHITNVKYIDFVRKKYTRLYVT